MKEHHEKKTSSNQIHLRIIISDYESERNYWKKEDIR